MTISLLINPTNSAIEMAETNDMSGNTDWIRKEVTDAEAETLLSDRIRDDHGAAYYKLVNGEITERTEEERRKEWGEDEPQQLSIDQRMTTAEGNINDLNTALDVILEGRMPE